MGQSLAANRTWAPRGIPPSGGDVDSSLVRPPGLRPRIAASDGGFERRAQGHVILQVIRGRARPDQVDALGAALDERLGSDGHEDRGPLRFHWGTRPAGDELDTIIISSWSSFEALVDADARGISPL